MSLYAPVPSSRTLPRSSRLIAWPGSAWECSPAIVPLRSSYTSRRASRVRYDCREMSRRHRSVRTSSMLRRYSATRSRAAHHTSVHTVAFLPSGEAPGSLPAFTVWLLFVLLGLITGSVLVLFCLQYSSDVQKLVGLAGSYPRLLRELEEEDTAPDSGTELETKGLADTQNVSGTSTSSDHTRDSGTSTPALVGDEDSCETGSLDEGPRNARSGERQPRALTVSNWGRRSAGAGGGGGSGESEAAEKRRSSRRSSAAFRKALALQD